MRRFGIVMLLVALMSVPAVSASATPEPFPDVIDLPGGFFPEGIAVGESNTAFVGSLVDGAIWKGDLRSGAGDILVTGTEGHIAVGLDYDRSTGHLWVSGGPTGAASVYDGDTGATVAVVDLPGAGFVNDVIVTQDAAYFTDSFIPQLFAVPLTPAGAIAGAPTVIPLGGDFAFEAGQFNANGIEATPDGGTLIVVNSFFGEIYTVDPSTGVASIIDLGGAVVNGDGLVLIGPFLYAVENSKNQIAKLRLRPDLASGTVAAVITNDAFDVPTTAARLGGSLYAVNAKFGTPALPTTPYEIVRVDR